MTDLEKTSRLGHTMHEGGIVLKRRVDIIQRAALGMELPGEPILGTPLVEVYGSARVLIENHCGVTGYSACEIAVRTSTCTYCIRGNQLEIVSMTKHRLVIKGAIESVVIVNRR